MASIICPYAGCGGRAMKTIYSQIPESARFPRRYTGRNLVRRSKRCLTCERTFFTIEIVEQDYQLNYQEPPGRGI
jgi:transcriptional regulator NrdR family protein